MGNGTKIGLVLVLVLVVVVIANLLDNEVGKGPSGPEQAPKLEDRADPARGRTSGSTPAAPRPGDREPATSGYESGRERRLTGNDPRSPAPTGRTPAGSSGSAPSSVLGDRGLASDPSGLRPSPTAAGRPGPLDATPATARPGSGSETAIRPASAQDPADAGIPSVTGDTPSRPEPRVDLVGRDPSESAAGRTPAGSSADLARSLGATPNPAAPTPGGATPPPAAGSSAPAATPPAAPPREEAARAAQGFPREHVVAEGESLWKIADKYYQKPSLFTLILENNPSLGSGEEIRVGMKIKIPAPPASVAVKSAGAPAAGASGTTASKPTPAAPAPRAGFKSYTIQDGDTLYDIAEDRLGNGNRWTEIQTANPGLDPSKLRVGATIQIPGA